MARNALPRRAYQPKPHQIPVLFRFSPADGRKLKVWPHLALAALLTGQADDGQVNDIAARLGLAYVQASDRYPEDIDAHKAGQEALRAIRARHERTSQWGISGDESRAIGKCLNLADEYQDASTRKQLLEDSQLHYAINETAKETA